MILYFFFFCRSDIDSWWDSSSIIQPAGGPIKVPSYRTAVWPPAAAICHPHVSTSNNQKHQPLPAPASCRYVKKTQHSYSWLFRGKRAPSLAGLGYSSNKKFDSTHYCFMSLCYVLVSQIDWKRNIINSSSNIFDEQLIIGSLYLNWLLWLSCPTCP